MQCFLKKLKCWSFFLWKTCMWIFKFLWLILSIAYVTFSHNGENSVWVQLSVPQCDASETCTLQVMQCIFPNCHSHIRQWLHHHHQARPPFLSLRGSWSLPSWSESRHQRASPFWFTSSLLPSCCIAHFFTHCACTFSEQGSSILCFELVFVLPLVGYACYCSLVLRFWSIRKICIYSLGSLCKLNQYLMELMS